MLHGVHVQLQRVGAVYLDVGIEFQDFIRFQQVLPELYAIFEA